jgi:hypothetical protein
LLPEIPTSGYRIRHRSAGEGCGGALDFERQKLVARGTAIGLIRRQLGKMAIPPAACWPEENPQVGVPIQVIR